MRPQSPNHHCYLIIGSGPAGLQLAYFLERAGHDYLVLEEKERPGAFFEDLPRHRTLLSINKIYTGYEDAETNLRWDWNSLLSDDGPRFSDFTKEYLPHADYLLDYLGSFAEAHDLKIEYRARVATVRKNSRFEVQLADEREFTCDRLIVATGAAQPYTPPIPGIELVEQYVDMPIDPADFANQRVLVIGKGNSGFETAEHLIGTSSIIHVLSPRPVKMAWKTHFVGHLRAVNNNFLDTYQLKSQNAVLDATIHKITKRDDKLVVSVGYSHAQGEHEDLVYDRVICCTGFKFDDSIFDESCKPNLVLEDRFPAQTSAWESPNVPDLYFAGTLMQVRDYKKATSSFIHGFRYNIRFLSHHFEHKYHGRPLPSRQIDATPESVVEALLGRINCTSALWHQFGFLCDRVAVDPDGTARYSEELPIAYVHDTELGRHPDYFLLTLEFGPSQNDPFNIQRQPFPENANSSAFLHPVVRHYSGPEKLSEHHVLENLYGEWKNPRHHREPLLEFVTQEMAMEAALSQSNVGGALQ